MLWLRPDGQEMRDEDWAAAERRTLGVLFDGDAIPETDARGRRIVGDTLLIVLNAGAADAAFVMTRRAGAQWERLIDTAEPSGRSITATAGSTVVVAARSAAVFRQT